MSDSEGTAGSDDEVTEFKCRKCPGKTFTAAEKDAHRMFHREQKDKDKKKRPGPKSKTGRASRSQREVSPTQSVATLFEAVPSNDYPPQKTGKRKKKESKAAPTPKRKSRKNYDQDAIGEWSRGNGA